MKRIMIGRGLIIMVLDGKSAMCSGAHDCIIEAGFGLWPGLYVHAGDALAI